MDRPLRVAFAVLAGLLLSCTGAPAGSPGGGSPTTGPTSASTDLPGPGSPAATASSTAPTPPGQTPPAVTTISSADGVVRLDIPTAAMPAGVQIAIEPRPREQQPQELLDAGVGQAHYALLPEGTTFSQPITISETYPLSRFIRPEGLPLLVLATRTVEGGWEWLAEPVMTVIGEVVTLSGTTTHFSTLFVWSDRTDLVVDPSVPHTDLVGATFARHLELVSRDQRTNPLALTRGSIGYQNHDPDVISLTEGSDSAFESDRLWTCLTAGEYSVTFSAEVGNFAADNPFWTDRLSLPATEADVSVELPGRCVEETVLLDFICVHVIHQPLDDFLSYLDWLMGVSGEDVDSIEVTLQGAADDEPVTLELDGGGHWRGSLGLRQSGAKRIVRVVVFPDVGDPIDITADVIGQLGGDTINVPFPDQPSFGDCPD